MSRMSHVDRVVVPKSSFTCRRPHRCGAAPGEKNKKMPGRRTGGNRRLPTLPPRGSLAMARDLLNTAIALRKAGYSRPRAAP